MNEIEPMADDVVGPLRRVKCSAEGNVTVLVFTRVARARQPKVARQIMNGQPDVEQVGYVEAPNDPEAVCRLQMMGGEFCGNAARCLGWVLSQKGWLTPPGDGELLIEVSGARRLVRVQICGRMVRVEMPIKRELSSVSWKGDKTLVELEGITHVLINHPPPPNVMAAAEQILNETGLREREAAGVLFWEPRHDGISMKPIVWVRESDTLIAETACASGSAALALARAVSEQRSQSGLKVFQPGGGVIVASVQLAGGGFASASIEGPAEIIEEDVEIRSGAT